MNLPDIAICCSLIDQMMPTGTYECRQVPTLPGTYMDIYLICKSATSKDSHVPLAAFYIWRRSIAELMLSLGRNHSFCRYSSSPSRLHFKVLLKLHFNITAVIEDSEPHAVIEEPHAEIKELCLPNHTLESREYGPRQPHSSGCSAIVGMTQAI